jgi:hypothetical protein
MKIKKLDTYLTLTFLIACGLYKFKSASLNIIHMIFNDLTRIISNAYIFIRIHRFSIYLLIYFKYSQSYYFCCKYIFYNRDTEMLTYLRLWLHLIINLSIS